MIFDSIARSATMILKLFCNWCHILCKTVTEWLSDSHNQSFSLKRASIFAAIRFLPPRRKEHKSSWQKCMVVIVVNRGAPGGVHVRHASSLVDKMLALAVNLSWQFVSQSVFSDTVSLRIKISSYDTCFKDIFLNFKIGFVITPELTYWNLRFGQNGTDRNFSVGPVLTLNFNKLVLV